MEGILLLYFFPETDGNHSYGLFKPRMCNSGKKWNRGVTYKSEYIKIGIGLNPPPPIGNQYNSTDLEKLI